MHDTEPATPTLADLTARWEAADAAVKAHAAKGRLNSEKPPEDDLRRQASDDAHGVWAAEWDRLQAEVRAAVVALHRAREAADENAKES